MTSKDWGFLGVGSVVLAAIALNQFAFRRSSESVSPDLSLPQATAPSTAGSYVSGEIAFDPPSQMYVSQSQVIEVRIGQKITEEMRKELIRLPQVKKIGIPANGRDKMRAELKGSRLDFDIEYQGTGSMEKIVTKDESAYWSWNVTPKRVGKNRELTLIASILLTDKKGNLVKGSDGKPIAKDTPFHRQINIDVDPSNIPATASVAPAAAPAAPSAAVGNGATTSSPASGKSDEPKNKTFVERVLEEPLKAMLMILLPAIGTALAVRLTKKSPPKRRPKPKEKPNPPTE